MANGKVSEFGKIGDEMLAVINGSERTSVDKDLLDRRPLRYHSESADNTERVSDEDKRILCTQVRGIKFSLNAQILKPKRLLNKNFFFFC